MAGEVNLSISNDVVKSIVESKIKSEVLNALAGNSERIMEQLTDNIIRQKVDREGRPSSSSYDTVNMLDFMIQKEVHAMSAQAIREWMSAQGEVIKKSVIKSLEKNKDKFADSLVQSLIQETKSDMKYRVTVSTPGLPDNYDRRLSALENKLNK